MIKDAGLSFKTQLKIEFLPPNNAGIGIHLSNWHLLRLLLRHSREFPYLPQQFHLFLSNIIFFLTVTIVKSLWIEDIMVIYFIFVFVFVVLCSQNVCPFYTGKNLTLFLFDFFLFHNTSMLLCNMKHSQKMFWSHKTEREAGFPLLNIFPPPQHMWCVWFCDWQK